MACLYSEQAAIFSLNFRMCSCKTENILCVFDLWQRSSSLLLQLAAALEGKLVFQNEERRYFTPAVLLGDPDVNVHVNT